MSPRGPWGPRERARRARNDARRVPLGLRIALITFILSAAYAGWCEWRVTGWAPDALWAILMALLYWNQRADLEQARAAILAERLLRSPEAFAASSDATPEKDDL